LLPRGRGDAQQVAVAPEGMDEAASDGRGGARPGAPPVALELVERPDGHRPGFLAGLDVDGDEELDLAAAADRIEPVADDRGTGVADAGVGEGPEQLRPFRRPLRE